MIYFLGWIAILQLIFISGVHFYWAFGGKRGIRRVIPTKTNEDEVMNPPVIAVILVGLFLAFFTLLYSEKLQFVSIKFLPNYSRLVNRIINQVMI